MGCSICGGEQYEAEPHETEEHTEDWVSLADARETGEVIFMPNLMVYNALETLGINRTLNEKVKTHVDRRIVQALVDALIETDPWGDPSVGIFENYDATGSLELLQDQLKAHPLKELDEDIN
jgi:hypothetical protein